MTKEDTEKYWPRATLVQQATIRLYHASGWTIENQEPDEEFVRISQPTSYDTTTHGRIWPDGMVTT